MYVEHTQNSCKSVRKRDNPTKTEQRLTCPVYIKTGQSNVLHNSPKLETTQISIYNKLINCGRFIHTMGHYMDTNENKQTSPTCSNMNKS